jgi:uncharacterized protein
MAHLASLRILVCTRREVKEPASPDVPYTSGVSKVDLLRRGLVACGLLAAGGWRHAAASAVASFAQAGSIPLDALKYGQVQFDPGPLKCQAQGNHRLLLDLDENALLRPFRVRAGLPAPGHDLGGWYGTYAFAPGATFGQWMSALSRHYAITGDTATRDKVLRLVRGYADTIDADGSFYQENRFPAYTYDKLVGGLLDAHQLAQDDAALPILARATGEALPFLPPGAIPRNEHAEPGEDFSEHAWDESYTVPENQFLAWRVTGERVHLDLGRRFLYEEFFDALARGENALPGKHAYSHVNGLSSAAQAYLTLGTPKYLSAAQKGFQLIGAQSFATGGWGPDEHFVVPGSGALGDSIANQRNSFETPCGSYAHFKLSRYLLRITRDSGYGDSMERVLYNTVLGAKPIQPDGHAFYYSDYTRQATKTFHPDPWPCCSGTLPMIAADYAISACFTDPNGLYVNLYVPAQVAWRQNGARCALSIKTDYPFDALVNMTLRIPRPQTFTLNLRIPSFAQGASVAINGRREMRALEPGRFAAIRREWRPADRIELELPLMRRLESVDAEHPDTVALLAGPLVLMHILSDDNAAAAPITRTGLLAAQREQTGQHEWQARAGGGSRTLKAFPDIDAERYSVYQDVLPS